MTLFSVHIASDASLQEFPSNITSDFRVNMPTWSELEGTWEVAMTDLYYPVHGKIQNVLEPVEFWVYNKPQLTSKPTDSDALGRLVKQL